MKDDDDYAKQYSEEKYWDKVKKNALCAGSVVIEKSLCIFAALKDKDTPAWAKTVIIGSLGYFISPIDAIPDITPLVGFADDLGALTIAFATVATHIKDEHVEQAKKTMTKWFGSSET